MYTDKLDSSWDELKGKVKKQWYKLTDDDINEIEGDVNKLVAHVASAYGKNKDEIEKEVKQFLSDNQVGEKVKQIKEEIVNNAEKIKENVQQYSSQVAEFVKESPFKSALILGAVGLIAGYLLHNRS